MSETRTSFSKAARLCQMYLDQYRVYETAQATPDMQRTVALAEKGLVGLLFSLEKVMAPITFMHVLESEHAKENADD